MVPASRSIGGKVVTKPLVALHTSVSYAAAAATQRCAVSKPREDAPNQLTHHHQTPLVDQAPQVDRPSPQVDRPPPVAPPLQPVARLCGSGSELPTPVSPSVLQEVLVGYDCELLNYLVHGFSYGFHIGCFGLPTQSDADICNLKSADEFSGIIDSKIAKELLLGRVLGPFTVPPPYHNYRISPLGVVAKKTPGEFRMIHHLSYPEGSSVNDYIPKDMSSVH